MTPREPRRTFLRTLFAVIVTPLVLPQRDSAAADVWGPHPTPRPGITAAKVATRAQLADAPDAVAVFDQVREIPGVVDGVRCNCGCADAKGYHSLLSCFETPDVMAKHCEVCQAQGRLVARMHKAGRSLDEIRRGVDARFG